MSVVGQKCTDVSEKPVASIIGVWTGFVFQLRTLTKLSKGPPIMSGRTITQVCLRPVPSRKRTGYKQETDFVFPFLILSLFLAFFPLSTCKRGVNIIRIWSEVMNRLKVEGSDAKIFGGMCLSSLIYTYVLYMWLLYSMLSDICFVSFVLCFS